MNTLNYLPFDQVNPDDFIDLLNKPKIRKHLIGHDQFTPDSVRSWMQSKIGVDAEPGCRVRAVTCDHTLMGWCGIQHEEGQYEIAIVIDEQFWGQGRKIFQQLMAWAKELGHQEVFIHFLHTRPEYRFLKKIASRVYETELFGSRFTTYQLPVN